MKIDYLSFPNPSFIRENILFLDDWVFSTNNKTFEKIIVPFCPESKLSGLQLTGFINECYYETEFVNSFNDRCILHFGAVDYRTDVFINNQYVGSHVGGFTPFEFDITDYLKDGTNKLNISVFDNERRSSLTGKQSYKLNSFGCFYTRTTGIWQKVWLENRKDKFIKQFYFYPNVTNKMLTIDLITNSCGNYNIEVFYKNKLVGSQIGKIEYRKKINIKLNTISLWSEGKGNLYDIKLSFEKDVVFSYFGMREVYYKNLDFYLNGKKCYQKLVLDQGYYSDGIYTAKDIFELEKDIKLALDLGFNGARLHQKVFDPRYLFLADKYGFLVWGEMPSWGVDYSNLNFVGRFIDEWTQVLNRDFNHPSIITWCPINEAWGTWEDNKETRDIKFVEQIYKFTKDFDKTRPCIDASGGHHSRKTDLFDFHCYEDNKSLNKYLCDLDNKGILNIPLLYCKKEKVFYKKNLPVNLSECGGRIFSTKCINSVSTINNGPVLNQDDWGYGMNLVGGEGFVKYYSELINIIKNCKTISGFCYTQLYDVEQEQNGFYTFERKDKLTNKQKELIKKINNSIDY
ncbi:MAG: hypothetical protein MJ179_03985 [Treponema sp.]|nr:hypothetical protein [Treponema sp.]